MTKLFHTFTALFVMGTSALYAQQALFTQTVHDTYESYSLRDITSKRLKHDGMMKIVDSLRASMEDILTVKKLGSSSEGRSIDLLKLGSGKKRIFLWSQMHGDEPTATMGILDVLSFISRNRNVTEVKKILSETTLLIIPMLNPDGAERFQRRSVHGIDINRDALCMQTNEAKILKETRDKYTPEFGFNLHDQEPRYTVGASGKVATIALLAPAYDSAGSENAVRLRAKKVAARLVDIFSAYIPGHISRYDETFEPRAFGDNIQKWGTSTVLIESGGWKNDPEKMYIRKLNCVALLGICYSIATDDYEKADVSRYEKLSENTKNLCDLIIHGVTLTFGNGISPVVVDLGIDFEESSDTGSGRQRRGRIVDIGDLSTLAAFERIDAKGKSIDAGTVKVERGVDVDKLLEGLKEK